MKTLTCALTLCVLTFAIGERTVFSQARATGSYTLTPVANGVQLRTPDGRVVLEYVTTKPAGVPLTGPNAACFHPINTP